MPTARSMEARNVFCGERAGNPGTDALPLPARCLTASAVQNLAGVLVRPPKTPAASCIRSRTVVCELGRLGPNAAATITCSHAAAARRFVGDAVHRVELSRAALHLTKFSTLRLSG